MTEVLEDESRDDLMIGLHARIRQLDAYLKNALDDVERLEDENQAVWRLTNRLQRQNKTYRIAMRRMNKENADLRDMLVDN